MAVFENWGDYFWPGQIDDCMVNKLGIHDATELREQERLATYLRMLELVRHKVKLPQTFDLDHLRAIHRHLFQDVYDWAGEPRVTELVRPSDDPNEPPHEFVPPEQIEAMAERVVFPQADPALLEGDRRTRSEQLAKVYAALNVLHPFVEGNGRTQRLFLADLAATAGLAIDWTRMPQQNAVMKQAFALGYEPVLGALEHCIVESGDPAYARARSSALAP